MSHTNIYRINFPELEVMVLWVYPRIVTFPNRVVEKTNVFRSNQIFTFFPKDCEDIMVVRIIWILSTSKMHTAVIFPNHGPPSLCFLSHILSCIDFSYKTIQYVSCVHHSKYRYAHKNTNRHTLRAEWCPWRLFDCTRKVSTNFSDKILPEPSIFNFLPSLSPSLFHFILSICVSLSPYSTLYYSI